MLLGEVLLRYLGRSYLLVLKVSRVRLLRYRRVELDSVRTRFKGTSMCIVPPHCYITKVLYFHLLSIDN